MCIRDRSVPKDSCLLGSTFYFNVSDPECTDSWVILGDHMRVVFRFHKRFVDKELTKSRSIGQLMLIIVSHIVYNVKS